jgi:hypothetical protein
MSHCDRSISLPPLATVNTIMSLGAVPARDLSIPDLLHMLNQKLGLERVRLPRSLPPVASAASLESEVSMRWSAHLDECLTPVSDRSEALKPQYKRS